MILNDVIWFNLIHQNLPVSPPMAITAFWPGTAAAARRLTAAGSGGAGRQAAASEEAKADLLGKSVWKTEATQPKWFRKLTEWFSYVVLVTSCLTSMTSNMNCIGTVFIHPTSTTFPPSDRPSGCQAQRHLRHLTTVSNLHEVETWFWMKSVLSVSQRRSGYFLIWPWKCSRTPPDSQHIHWRVCSAWVLSHNEQSENSPSMGHITTFNTIDRIGRFGRPHARYNRQLQYT